MRRILSSFCVSIVCALATAGCAPRDTGPWAMDTLQRAPGFTWAGAGDEARPLYYEGEPFEGKPTRVFAWYAAPATKQKLPAIVLVHGGGGKAFREWAELWARRGYAAIAMDLAGRGPDGERLPDGGPDQQDAEKFYAIARDPHAAWPYHAVANVIRAHSLLRSMPEVDPGRTAITGISWGGYLTCIAAGLDRRFRAAVPVYGCGFLHENSAWLKAFEKMPPADRELWIGTYDPSRYLPGCTLPMLFVNGTNDFAYPLDSYQKSYRLVRGPRTLCVTVRMPHSHTDGWAPREIGLFVDSVLGEGKPLARLDSPHRRGTEVFAAVSSVAPLASAALHYTTGTGPWQEREWKTGAATLEGSRVRAVLPTDHGIVYFLTVTDQRGAVVSTEHEAIPAEMSASRGMILADRRVQRLRWP